MQSSSRITIRWAVAVALPLLIALPASFAQAPGDPALGMPEMQQAAPLLSPDQLNNMVAPIALYPDPLLGQVLSASTYPLEIVEAQQWLRENNNLQGAQLMDAARQQNWDPSVQALVAFPDALELLANDIRWTADLGNAFLAQQADVMSAIQRMRVRARANGRLTTTPQQVVTTATQGDREVIVIAPADPQVIYVPIYSPSYVWGPPLWGAYPDLWYPAGFGFRFGFGPAYYMSAYFPTWGGWGGWGWGCGWFGGGLYVNVGFFHSYGFRGGYYGRYGGYDRGRGFGGRASWRHDPGHRMGVPYPNRTVAGRFSGGSRFNGARMNSGNFAGGARASGGQRSGGRFDSGRTGPSQSNRAGGGIGASRSTASGQWRKFGEGNRPSSPNYPATGASRSYQSRAQSGRSYGSAQSYRSSPSAGRSSTPGYSTRRSGGSSTRSYSAPSQSYSSPRSYSSSSPRSYGGGGSSRSYSAPSQGSSSPRSFSGSRPSGGGSVFSGGRSGGSSGFSGGRSGGSSGFSGGRSGGGSGSSGGRSGGGGGRRR